MDSDIFADVFNIAVINAFWTSSYEKISNMKDLCI